MRNIKKILIISIVFLSALTVSCKNINDKYSTNNATGFQSTNPKKNEILKVESDNKENEVLVAFFSGYDEVEKFAYVISDYTLADLYKINPVIEYTDMDYIDNENSRIFLEQKENLRPAILNNMKDIKKYKYIFLGFPIWYDKAPRIILKFLESFDFSKKIIIPFSMTDDYDIYNAINEIKSIVGSNVEVLDGFKFTSKTLLDEATSEVDNLNIEFKIDDRYDEE